MKFKYATDNRTWIVTLYKAGESKMRCNFQAASMGEARAQAEKAYPGWKSCHTERGKNKPAK